ncbi:hypothetical protein K488DRAFT_51680 [Vararia minispora EC-137]|uniref:Uncharacterized protein n=1 Tax=Vararia minispora EC-137 TaxID=1314806 RepID=A0ACB8QJ61_9AGAM|nr:hypothetical protein K488DRAFT_51680 [Vararia minispora EC-137]
MCDFCNEKPGTILCASCGRVRYCSDRCQERALCDHVFSCKPGVPVETAYILAKAVYLDLFPSDVQTRIDYGFTKALDWRQESNLLGLYTGLIKLLRIPPRVIHDWRVRGVLIQEIVNAYEKIPASYRGDYYPWFLQNRHLLRVNSPKLDGPIKLAHFKRAAWTFLGQPSSSANGKINTYFRSLPAYAKQCFLFYGSLCAQQQPGPGRTWIGFGFCAAKDLYEECQLARDYYQLIHLCTFDEFCSARSSCSLPDLFKAYGIKSSLGILNTVCRPVRQSVWDLKEYITLVYEYGVDADGEPILPPRPVSVDYGFVNCAGEREKKKLQELYKRYFSLSMADPLELHNAAIAGRLYKHMAEDKNIILEPKKLYMRLLQNPYPLVFPGSQSSSFANSNPDPLVRTWATGTLYLWIGLLVLALSGAYMLSFSSLVSCFCALFSHVNC